MNETLTTVYSENMTDIPHSYYPRPQLVRSSFISLNGVWDFAISPSREEFGYKEKITVPFPPESALSGICRKIGKQDYMHYRRRFTLPDGFMRGRLILHFGAVDQICSVYVNGTLAVEHEGGYIPFSADITALVKDGENEITVCALDQLTHLYPYGKQTRRRGGMWYTPVSGIWQSVWLESVPKSYIHELRITADMTSATVCTAGGDEKKTLRLGSGEVYEYVGNEITLTPSEPILWSPENPYLYHFTLECGEDKIESYFALREIGVAVFDGISRLTLNGEPYLFNGLLDQGYYPDGLFMPASADAWRDDIALAKRLGFNMLRKHIKIEPMMFYHLCDTMGIVVFQDMVNNSDYRFLRDTALPTLGLQCISDKNMNSTQCTRDVFLTTMADTAALLYST
ncbi:MAG: glycoside hydrolase family 2, partial [Clostridia bacterium]|nr:glycoside hydrolase family 2 [Clostridia bacterium]